MEKQKVSAGQYITVGDIRLLPITRTLMGCWEVNGGIICSGSMDLVGIVAVSPEGQRALNARGEEVPVDRYLEQVPGLKELLLTL